MVILEEYSKTEPLGFQKNSSKSFMYFYFFNIYIFFQSGSWAGSLMLKHIHPDFVSDIFTILETVGTQIVIGQ